MCLKTKLAQKQTGSALVIAVFIMTVMLLIASSLIKLLESNAEGVAYEVIGTRAFMAARTGAQKQLSEVFPLNGAASSCPANIPVIDLSLIEGLETCSASVTCSVSTGIDGVNYYLIESTGSCNAAQVVTSRTIQVEARSL